MLVKVYLDNIVWIQAMDNYVIIQTNTDQFVNNLTLFKIGFSWGGAYSLCLPYRIKQMRQDWQHDGILVRFNIGLEDAQDLIADIEQALNKLS